jgi:glutaminyl-peptide cyclotransferase
VRVGDSDFGAAAHARVVELMALPRALGHPDREASIAALERMLLQLGAPAVQRLQTSGVDPKTRRSYALTSLVAHVRPDAPRRFVLASHFDTRPWADESPDPADHVRPVPGANDGTSGVAVVLELATRLPSRLPQDVGLSIVLLDGEELGRPGFEGGYCVGSRDLAMRLRAGDDPVLAGAELGIVLDMVGDADLDVPIEPSSLRIHPTLVRHVWATAQRLGHAQLRAEPRPTGVFDDHRPLTDAGIPSILLIDHDYEPWHTTRDTIEHVSAQSLGAVGETVLEALVSWYGA